MKSLFASLALAMLPAFAVAAASDAGDAAAPQTVHKTVAKVSHARPKAQPMSSREQLHSAAKQVATGFEAAEKALTPEELAIAEKVYVGRMPCELGASVTVSADSAAPGYFNVEGKGFKYHMAPVVSATGAIRLEDQRAGAVWLQIPSKSMLMNQKIGQRMVDECMSAQQVAVAEALKKNPPPSLLDSRK